MASLYGFRRYPLPQPSELRSSMHYGSRHNSGKSEQCKKENITPRPTQKTTGKSHGNATFPILTLFAHWRPILPHRPTIVLTSVLPGISFARAFFLNVTASPRVVNVTTFRLARLHSNFFFSPTSQEPQPSKATPMLLASIWMPSRGYKTPSVTISTPLMVRRNLRIVNWNARVSGLIFSNMKTSSQSTSLKSPAS